MNHIVKVTFSQYSIYAITFSFNLNNDKLFYDFKFDYNLKLLSTHLDHRNGIIDFIPGIFLTPENVIEKIKLILIWQ